MRNLIYALILIVLSLGGSLKAENLVKYVNTLQGTDSNFGLSCGNTYPTTALPYPMHGWSAQTGKNGDGWKYQYSAKTIRGFQQTHQCSPWVGDYGVFSLMPVSGNLKVNEDQRASSFNHKNEIAKPHYYRVKFDNGIIAEMSPTTRCAHMRFSFPRYKQAFIILDGYIKLSSVHIDPERRRITGYVHNGNWIPDTFKSYFIIQFNKPFLSYGTWENKKNTIQEGQCLAEGEGVGAYIEFSKGAEVEIKVTSSYINLEQAEVTLEKELGNFSTLEQTKQMAFDEWNNLLNRVFVEGGSKEQKATFYSCMFRANLFSHKFYEEKSDGSPYYYSPYDGKIHDGYMYTDNGFWDTFRSQFPLTNILHPTMQGRYMNALLDAQEQCGWLPSWSFPSETGGMLGNHAVSLLADAWAKGIRTFSPERALEAYVHEAMNKGPWGGAMVDRDGKNITSWDMCLILNRWGLLHKHWNMPMMIFVVISLLKLRGILFMNKFLDETCLIIKMCMILLLVLCEAGKLMVNGASLIRMNGEDLIVKEMHGTILGRSFMMYRV